MPRFQPSLSAQKITASMYVFWLMLTFCWTVLSQVQAPVAGVEEFPPTSSFLGVAEIWTDSTGCMTTPDVAMQQSFQSIVTTELGNSNYGYWIKFPVENFTDSPIYYWLEVGVFDSLTLFQQTPKGWINQERGLLMYYDDQQRKKFQHLEEHKYGFSFEIPAATRSIFLLRIKNTIPL